MKIDEITSYITGLQKLFDTITKNSSNLVQRNRDVSKAAKDMGQNFVLLSESEKDDLVGVLSRAGETLDKSAEAGIESAEKEAIEVEEGLEEYLRILGSVHDTLKRREERRQAYISALTDHAVKDAAYNKVLGVPGKEDQASQKQQLVVKAQSSVDSAKDAFTELTAIFLVEFESFKERKSAELRDLVVKYSKLQIAIAKKQEGIWAKLLSEVDLGGGSSSARAYNPSLSTAALASSLSSSYSSTASAVTSTYNSSGLADHTNAAVSSLSAGIGNLSTAASNAWGSSSIGSRASAPAAAPPAAPVTQPPEHMPGWVSEPSHSDSHHSDNNGGYDEDMDNMEV